MVTDEIYLRKMEKLRNDLIVYMEGEYLEEFTYENKMKLGNALESWNKDQKMIDYVLMSILTEGIVDLKEANKGTLDKNIDRIIFNEFVEKIIKSTNLENLNIDREKRVVKVMAKEFLFKNAKELFARDIKTLHELSLKLENNRLVETTTFLKVVK